MTRKITPGDVMLDLSIPSWHDWHVVVVVSVDLLGQVEYASQNMTALQRKGWARSYSASDALRCLKHVATEKNT